MSAVLSKTLKDKDMDRIFAEVPCTEDLGLSKPGQLRLFHLLVRDGKFYHEDLEKWLYRNLSRYVFSQAMLEQLRKDDDLDAAIERAIQTMRENGAADEIAFLKDIIIPTPNVQSKYNTAYGVFLGYSIGVNAEGHPEIEYEQLVTKKMIEDIQRHAGYIADKIKSNGLDMHSFYIYILPFKDAETNKSEIMDHVMKGDVVL